MRFSNNQNGVTMIALTITIIVLVIITGITIVNMSDSLEMRKLNKLYDDISNLKTKVDTYYMEHNQLPTKGYYCGKATLRSILTENGATDINLDGNDGDNYYVIDLSRMEGVTLNYGEEFSKWESGTSIQDLYIVNETSHQIYYPKCIEFDEKEYYSYFTNETSTATTSTVSGSFGEITLTMSAENPIIVSSTKTNLSASLTMTGTGIEDYKWQYAWSLDSSSAENYIDFTPSIEGANATASSLESEKLGAGNYYIFVKQIDNYGNENPVCLNQNDAITITEKQIIISVIQNSAANGENGNSRGEVSVEVQFDNITLENMKYGQGDSLEKARKKIQTLGNLSDQDPSENVTKYTIHNVNGEKYFYVQGKDTTNGGVTSAYVYIFQQVSSDNGTISAYNSMQNGIVDYKIYGNSVQSNLPPGYTQLEYIENTGTQYINIGTIDMNSYKTKLEYTAQCLNKSKNNQRVFAYGAVSSNTNFTAWENIDRYYMSTLGTENLIGSNTTTQKHTTVMERTSETSATFTVDGSLIITGSGTFATSSRNAYVMGDPNNGQYYLGRIWSLKLWQNDVLTRNLIPCKDSSNEIGMYDTVTNTFYKNIGEGSFTGPIAVPSPETPIQIQSVGDKTENLFDGQIFIDNGATLQEDGSYYFADAWSGSGAVLWENNENYTGQMAISFKSKYNSTTERGLFVKILYTDSTTEEVWIFSDEYKTKKHVTQEGKTINKIKLDWGTRAISTNFLNFQIQKGSKVTDYEPYNKCKVPVTVSGKNLLYYKTAEVANATVIERFQYGAIVQGNSSGSNPGNNLYGNGYFQIGKSGSTGNKGVTLDYMDTVTISADITILEKYSDTSTNTIGIYLISQNPEDIKYNTSANTITSLSDAELNKKYRVSMTITNNKSNGERRSFYPIITLNSNKLKIENMQIEKGQYATDYEPYFEPVTYNIILDEPLRRLGNYADYIDLKDGKIVRNIKVVQYNGINMVDNFSYITTRYNDYTRFALRIFSPQNKKYKNVEMCNYFPYNTNNNKSTFAIGGNNGATVCLSDSLIGLTEDDDTALKKVNKANAWLQTLNPKLQIAYILETPIEQNMELPNLNLYRGTNYITAGTSIVPSKMEIDYLGE